MARPFLQTAVIVKVAQAKTAPTATLSDRWST